MTSEEERDFIAYLRGLQSAPHTIFIGYSVRTTLTREFRGRLPREMAEHNPDCGGMAVLEMGRWLEPDEYMVACPDNEDEKIRFFRAHAENVVP